MLLLIADADVLAQITQMKYRLTEGNGECFYYIGEHETEGCTAKRCTAFTPAARLMLAVLRQPQEVA